MGKVLDAVLGIVAFIFFLYIAYRLGLTLAEVEALFKHFFFGPGSSSSNLSAGLLFLTMSNSEKRIKVSERIVQFKRGLFEKFRTRIEKESQEREEN